MIKKYLTAMLCLLNAGSLYAQVIAGDLADPSIINVNNVYYATGTSSEWAPHFPIYKSANLKDWSQTGYVFDKAPDWTNGSFWAPEYYKINDTYLLYYTARRKSDNHSFIGVATSRYPDHGFTDHGIIIEHGKEAIDPFIFNDGGQLYISFKAYGLDDRPIELLGSKLSADGLKTEGELFSMLKDSNRAGMEGQSILKKGNYYYLFYSAGNCCGQECTYSINVARSVNFKGPYEYFDGNPVLSENEAWKCMGHGTFVTAKNGSTYYLHHGYNKKSTVFTGREGLLAALSWQKDWPVLKAQTAGVAAKADFYDNFERQQFWQWDFRHATPSVQRQKGLLRLSGKQTTDNLSGIVLTIRPTSDSFDITTSVINRNKALKGLVIYGDASAAVGIGVEGDSVKVWRVVNKQRVIIKAAAVPPAAVGLKITKNNNCSFFYQTDKRTWVELAADIDVKYLPQWDRSPRLGLHFKGDEKEYAQFSFFRLHNN